MSYEIKQEDFDAVEESPRGALGTVADIAQKYIIDPVESARLPEIAGGILQGALGGAASVANLPLQAINKLAGTDLAIPYPDLQQFAKSDPLSRGAFLGGEIAGSFVPGGAAFKSLQKALGSVAPASLLTEGLAGAGAGAAVSGGGEDDTQNRIIGALVGGSLPVASGLTSRGIAKKISQRKNKLEDFFANQYDDIFESLKKANLEKDSLRVPTQLKELRLPQAFAGNRQYLKSLNKFRESPTFENAHKAQSDLRRLEGKIGSKIQAGARSGVTAPSSLAEEKELANQLRARVRGSMQQFLAEKDPSLLNRYADVTTQYRDVMGPYLDPAIAKFTQGKIRPKKLVDSLLESEEFMKRGGAYKDIPGMATRGAVKESGADELIKRLLQGSALAAGATGAYQLGSPAIGGMLRKAGY